jgi:ABC-type Fe3+/spermidine/putrescine transport system ATPase subunit
MVNAIIVENATFTRDKATILKGISFAIEESQVFGLIGRSGCGKSTTLRLISGLSRPNSGQVLVFGRPAHEYTSSERCVATVWQDRALFPHFSVRGNLEFPLRARKVHKLERAKRLEEMEANFRLAGLLDRNVANLSGGEQQRVALARAMLVRPRILLLDEPFTGLDQELKLELQADLRDLVRLYRCTYVLVSHVQADVLSLSTRVAVLDNGEIIQQGTPMDLYGRPANAFIAKFVGGKNVIPATVRTFDSATTLAQVDVGPGESLWSATSWHKVAANDQVYYVIGPEHISLNGPGPFRTRGKILAREQNGAFEVLYLRLAKDVELRVSRFLGNGTASGASIGEMLALAWDPRQAFLLPRSGGPLLSR